MGSPCDASSDGANSEGSGSEENSTRQSKIAMKIKPYVDALCLVQFADGRQPTPINEDGNLANSTTAQRSLEERVWGVEADVLRQMYLDEHADYLAMLDDLVVLRAELDEHEEQLYAAHEARRVALTEVEQLRGRLVAADEATETLLQERAELLTKLAETKSELAELSARHVRVQREQQARHTPAPVNEDERTHVESHAVQRLRSSHDELQRRVRQLEDDLAAQRVRNEQLTRSEANLLTEVAQLAQQLRAVEARQRSAWSQPRTSLSRRAGTPSPHPPYHGDVTTDVVSSEGRRPHTARDDEVNTGEETRTVPVTVQAMPSSMEDDAGGLVRSPAVRSLEQRGVERVLRIASIVRRRQATLDALCTADSVVQS